MQYRTDGPPRALLAAGLAITLLGCAPLGVLPGSAPTLSPERIAEVVQAPDRSAADRVNDERRKPRQMLAFIGIRAGMVALDVSAGGGYTSELLARAIGPGGQVHGQSAPRDPARPPPAPAAAEGVSHPAAAAAAGPAAEPAAQAAAIRPAPRPSAVALAERSARLREAGVAAAPLSAVVQRFEDPVPAALAEGGLDLVTLMFNYHDLGYQGVDRERMNRALFRALKPGGLYVVADHAGRPGTGISESGTLHRIEEAFLRQEVEAAGFRLAGSADFLRNPADPRDRNTPEPAQPKDEFVLKFVKPGAP
jgi:predicted methyltransferase